MTLRTRLTTRLARSETAPSLLVVSDTRVGPTLASGVVVLLNDPERREALADAATTVVCGSSCLSAALRDAVDQTLPESTEPHV